MFSFKYFLISNHTMVLIQRLFPTDESDICTPFIYFYKSWTYDVFFNINTTENLSNCFTFFIAGKIPHS